MLEELSEAGSIEKGEGERKYEGCDRSGVDIESEEKDLFKEPPRLNLNT